MVLFALYLVLPPCLHFLVGQEGPHLHQFLASLSSLIQAHCLKCFLLSRSQLFVVVKHIFTAGQQLVNFCFKRSLGLELFYKLFRRHHSHVRLLEREADLFSQTVLLHDRIPAGDLPFHFVVSHLTFHPLLLRLGQWCRQHLCVPADGPHLPSELPVLFRLLQVHEQLMHCHFLFLGLREVILRHIKTGLGSWGNLPFPTQRPNSIQQFGMSEVVTVIIFFALVLADVHKLVLQLVSALSQKLQIRGRRHFKR
uniref:Secreted protein n=1 Tax=Ixodes ricinus TaxID=34613 RepID=A0A6B0V5V7_IXORI